MNLRCIYCQTPFTLSRNEMLGAIVTMNEKNLNHYDAHCPRCRRANSISRQRLELFVPNWQEAVKQFLAAPPAPKAETPSIAHLKTEPVSKAVKEAIEKKSVAASPAKDKKSATAKASAAKKPAATSSSKEKKPAEKKPAAAKKPAAKKK